MLKKISKKLLTGTYSNLLGLALIFAVLAFASDAFLTARNITNLTKQVAVVGILAVGMTPVILIKEIDLSVARVAVLCGVIAALLQVKYDQEAVTAIAVTILAGAVIGLWNGLLISIFRIPSFIITLGTMSMATGFAYLLTGSTAVGPMKPGFTAIGSGDIGNVITGIIMASAFFVYIANIRQQHLKRLAVKLPSNLNAGLYVKIAIVTVIGIFFGFIFVSYNGMPYSVAILLGMAIITGLLLYKTPFGRHVYAIGGNEKAAYLAGVNVRLVRIIVFVIMGVLSAVAGIVLTARLDSATPAMAQMYELDAIAAVVIGGTSLSGGKGTIGGSIIGTFIIGILNNGMSLMNIDIYWQWVFKGVIIIGAVLLDRKNKL